jgi:hypothetical protein
MAGQVYSVPLPEHRSGQPVASLLEAQGTDSTRLSIVVGIMRIRIEGISGNKRHVETSAMVVRQLPQCRHPLHPEHHQIAHVPVVTSDV